MADTDVPEHVRDFILKHIDSVAQIEALLLIRSQRQREWSLSQISARLYIAEPDAKDALAGLCAAGLLDRDNDLYRSDASSPENSELVEQLLSAYTRHLITVTKIIHAKPRRIRSFAEAFRFRKGS